MNDDKAHDRARWLLELERLDLSASPGPWAVGDDGVLRSVSDGSEDRIVHVLSHRKLWWDDNDSRFVVAARGAVPRLVSEARAVDAALDTADVPNVHVQVGYGVLGPAERVRLLAAQRDRARAIVDAACAVMECTPEELCRCVLGLVGVSPTEAIDRDETEARLLGLPEAQQTVKAWLESPRRFAAILSAGWRSPREKEASRLLYAYVRWLRTNQEASAHDDEKGETI